MLMQNEHLYTKGTRVWVPDPEHVWIGASLLEDLKDDQLELELEDGREVALDLKTAHHKLPPLRNPEILVGSNDLTTLSYLHEPAVLHNLQERFLNSQCIYTYCGIVLVALNPYQSVPLYGPEIISEYNGKQAHEIDPHIYAVAENAFRSMVTLDQNQSIIVSGESGAGKTVSAKYAMRYFANVGGSIVESTVEQKVLASNPIMEAIGNAKTIRNDNSSRFGKYIEINFDHSNGIIGANMRTYLLEKSRVVFQAQNERNYHIFHQLCACSEQPEMQELKLGSSMEFYYTQQGENPTINGVDDAKNFNETCEALSMLGIYSEQQRMIWRILAAILHLGNVSIDSTSKKNEECGIRPEDIHLTMVATLLGIDKNQLRKWLCARKIVATGDVYVKPLTLSEANNGRDALAKHIYSMLFKWIVEHINSSLAITTQRKSFIGVLDIYGFETFEVNSFEQFCINYANEKLQQQFNMHVFKLEQEEYVREKITWSFIDFYDNQSCIDLIETKLGILDLLDEECRMPKGSDDAWALKLYKQHVKKSEHFIKPRMSEKAFIIRHYADDVIYDCEGFVEKNRDLINEEHINLLCASEYELVAELFRTDNQQASLHAPRKRTSSRVGKSAPKGKKTVGSEFRDSLKMLMDTLNSTSPHYVRCIKSNDAKEAFQLDLHRCVQQLRACGVLETIRISAAGYPSRWTYNEFFDRYRMLINWKQINWDSLNDTCNIILSAHIQDDDKFQLGKTKIFFRAGAVAYLERLRSDKLRRSCVMIQKNVKCWLMHKRYLKQRKSAIAIQCWVRGYRAKRFVQNLRETRAAIRIQKIWLGYSTRKWYLKTRQQIIEIQAHIRGVLARRRLRAKIEQLKAVVIQKYWRMYMARTEYTKTRKGIILIQCCVRRTAAKKELKRLKIEAKSVDHLKKLNKGMENKVISLQQRINADMEEKKALTAKVNQLASLEEEMQKMGNLQPQMDLLVKTQEKLTNEKEDLIKEKNLQEEKSKQLEEQIENVGKTKDEEIAKLKEALALLQKSFDEQVTKNEQILKDEETLIEEKLQKQKDELVNEFNLERSTHQKMIGEYSRLEQRFDNLQQELEIEKSSPDKRLRSHFSSESFEILSQKGTENGIADDEVSHELTRERDMLLEQVELLKEEHNISVHVHEADEERAYLNFRKQKDELLNENNRLVRELDVMRQAFKSKDDNSAITKLLAEINELRHENSLLRNKLARKNGEGARPGAWVAELVSSNPETQNRKESHGSIKNGTERLYSTGSISDNNNLSDAAQKEVSRLTMENITLKEEIERLKKENSFSTNSNSAVKNLNKSSTLFEESVGLGPRTRSNVTELMRKRSQTMENRINEENLSEAGKLLMTYAGLTRKKQDTLKPLDSNENGLERKLGMVKFNVSNQDKLVRKLVTDMKSEYVEKEMPGLPAHIMFMSIRYIDYVNQERLMQGYLTAIISSIKKRATENLGDIDNQAFWLAITYRLFCNMKQFSGDQQFQSMNTREQNEHCLANFDLSEYRQVLSDTCVKIYQDMVQNVQSRINNLIVPGMLEYESIPGVVSTLRRFKSEQMKSEEIITVKDITNKLSAILAVLNAHCVDPSLIKQIFRQIYYFINATMINTILLRKDMCHWSRGLQVKFNLTQLEEWCRTNQLHDRNGVVEQLEAITEVVQLLQVNKKSLEDVDGIIAIVKNLNALQVQKLLSMYTPPNEYEPRIPGNLIRAVVAKLPKVKDMILMFDLKHITPMIVGFAPSNVVLDKIVIPKEIGLDDIAEII